MTKVEITADNNIVFLKAPTDFGSVIIEMSLDECTNLKESLCRAINSLNDVHKIQTDAGVLKSSIQHTLTAAECHAGCFSLGVSLLAVDTDKVHIFLESQFYRDYKYDPNFKRYFSKGDFDICGDLIVFKDFEISTLLCPGIELMIGIVE